LLSVSEAVRLLNISRAKTYKMVRTGELPAFEFAGRLKISYEQLRKLIRERALAKREGPHQLDGAGLLWLVHCGS